MSTPGSPAPEAAGTGRFTSALLGLYALAFLPSVLVAIILTGMAQAGGDTTVSGPVLWLWFTAAAAPTAAAIGVLFAAKSHPSPAIARTALIVAGVSVLLLVVALLFGWPKLTLMAGLLVWAAVLRTRWVVTAAVALFATLVLPMLLTAVAGGHVPLIVGPVIDAVALVTLIACAVKARISRA
ncbi:hypothetical protein GCM10027591_07400 [Zhihengliuella somnathii]